MANISQIQETVEKRVPLFYGQVDVDPSDVHFFIDACKKVEKLFAGKPEQLTLLLEEVMFRLRGRAYTLFKDQTVKDLKEFYGVLTKKFLPAYTVESLQNRLREARQNKAESCAEFGSRVQSYALDYEAGVRAKYGDDNALPKPLVASMEQDAFMRGLLNEAIRMHLSMVTSKSTKELVEMADRIERQLGYSPSKTEETSGQEYTQSRCQLCDKLGHSAKTCRQNIQKHTQKSNKLPNLVCRYCKRVGHVLENCATRRAANERYQMLHAQPQFYSQNYQTNYPSRDQRHFEPSPQILPNRNLNNSPNKRNQYPPHTTNQTRSPPPTVNQRQPNYRARDQQNYQTQNTNINQLTNKLQRMNINYIENVDEDSTHHQGNGERLVEHQQHQL